MMFSQQKLSGPTNWYPAINHTSHPPICETFWQQCFLTVPMLRNLLAVKKISAYLHVCPRNCWTLDNPWTHGQIHVEALHSGPHGDPVWRVFESPLAKEAAWSSRETWASWKWSSCDKVLIGMDGPHESWKLDHNFNAQFHKNHGSQVLNIGYSRLNIVHNSSKKRDGCHLLANLQLSAGCLPSIQRSTSPAGKLQLMLWRTETAEIVVTSLVEECACTWESHQDLAIPYPTRSLFPASKTPHFLPNYFFRCIT